MRCFYVSLQKDYYHYRRLHRHAPWGREKAPIRLRQVIIIIMSSKAKTNAPAPDTAVFPFRVLIVLRHKYHHHHHHHHHHSIIITMIITNIIIIITTTINMIIIIIIVKL